MEAAFISLMMKENKDRIFLFLLFKILAFTGGTSGKEFCDAGDIRETVCSLILEKNILESERKKRK